MKVLLINGSPHQKGCTFTALNIIAEELARQDVESEIAWIGADAVHGCTGCGYCAKNEKCIFGGDVLNEIAAKAKTADGYIFGAPVHYASPAGAMVSLMDRLFYSAGKDLRYKPAACVTVARRAGTTAAYDVLNKYIGINHMIQVPSCYWNMAHGAKAEEVLQDEEGVSIMRTLASNMVWLLKLLENAKGTPFERPVPIPTARTNFIR